jgi:catechol 2,3-dioxygenase-like lactoylglutathione lyase family enzyme
MEGMPLGDPGGGSFAYTIEGLPQNIFVAVVPVKDPEKSLSFYRDLLGMEETYRSDNEIGVMRDGARLILRRSDRAGVDTGIYIGVNNPFDLHRRLIDEGVVFVEDPKREPWGVSTSFKDDDGNIIRAIEMNADIRA